MTQLTFECRRESYQKIEATAPDERARVLAVISEGQGMTAEQISKALNKPTYQVRPRITELCQAGLVHAVGKAWSETTKRNISIFKVVP